MTSFKDLGLAPDLLATLEQAGYATPTPIQAQAIPIVLQGHDLLGIAQTGTGKTAAFALPILQRLAQDKRPAPRKGARALILSPTRELASQIAESFKTYGRGMGFGIDVVFGGVSHRPQMHSLTRGLDILVATPGRLLDHMAEGVYSPGATEVLVLDEADQMLDLGFIQPLRRIFRQLPAARQNLFFSATMPKEIGQLADELLRSPQKVQVTPVAKTADRVEQKVVFVEAAKKRSLLVELLADPAMSRTLVFTRTKRGADKVARHLEAAGITASALHGNKSQRQRELALAAFKASKVRALVATDIAARGIDIDLVTHVVNYELPNVPEAYVHRIGRTARAGAEGIAISLVDGEERAYLRDIERLTRQTIPVQDRRGDDSLQAVSRRDDRGGEGDDGERRGPRGDRQGRGGPGGREGGRRFARGGGGGGADRRGSRDARFERPAGERPVAGERGEDRRGDRRGEPRREDQRGPQSQRDGGGRPARPRFGDRAREEHREPRSHQGHRGPRTEQNRRDDRGESRWGEAAPRSRDTGDGGARGWPFSDAPQAVRSERGPRGGHDRRERFERGEGRPARSSQGDRAGRHERDRSAGGSEGRRPGASGDGRPRHGGGGSGFGGHGQRQGGHRSGGGQRSQARDGGAARRRDRD